ncbi:MAG: SIMPL domain-containing protein [Campylobacterales bacterium]
MQNIVAKLVLAIGIVAGAWILGDFYYKSKEIKNPTVKATGVAKKDFESDIVKWKVSFGEQVPLNELERGLKSVQQQIERFSDFLVKNGIKSEDITIIPPTNYKNYNRDGQPSSYNVSQEMFVISKNIKMIEELALKPSKLESLNLNMSLNNLEFFYSKLDDLKLELLSLAAENAKKRAVEITKGNSYEVGDMINARSGIFQITEPYSTDVSQYGVYNTQSSKKEIRVTVHATFELKK